MAKGGRRLGEQELLLLVPTPPLSRRWTLSELTLLSRMAATGATAEQIAQVLGRTVAAVRMKAAHQRVAVVLTGRQRPSPSAPPEPLRTARRED